MKKLAFLAILRENLPKGNIRPIFLREKLHY
jgi:hypothetical protein